MKKLLVASFILIAVLLTACSNKPDKEAIYFIPTLHGYHNQNPNYSFDSLRLIIASLNPDIIAVEIRSEDINADSVYLANSYPYEMRMMHSWFPSVEIVGFDWLGEELERRMIPDGFWESGQSSLKEPENKLAQDSLYTNKIKLCNLRGKERDSLVRNCTLEQLLVSADEEIVREYYACLSQTLKGSPHEDLMMLTDKRNDKITENINHIIQSNKGKRIVILTGDNHYQVLKDVIKHKNIYPVK